ncbi:hypothetical protein N782_10785 [Pontibacillus yanchengensis Y32]|uniref:Uncharacterized protein n=1 Tax=Pontibacillus yanchengensis Y32 TaxID=1385514 RepID=A0A0A2TAA0_9BACI|nr:hypothetical protein N782_10785 [Pontibacillus yanchengensis Y32]
MLNLFIMFFCMLIMLIGVLTAYFYSWFMMRHTPYYVPHVYVSAVIHILFGYLALLCWFYYAYENTPLLWYKGTLIGAWISFIGLLMLLILLFLQKEQLCGTKARGALLAT